MPGAPYTRYCHSGHFLPARVFSRDLPNGSIHKSGVGAGSPYTRYNLSAVLCLTLSLTKISRTKASRQFAPMWEHKTRPVIPSEAEGSHGK